jgi:hypothetical protein
VSDIGAEILTVHNYGEAVVTILPDGKLKFGANYNPDDAARLFWEAVSKMGCEMVEKAVASEREKYEAGWIPRGVVVSMIADAVLREREACAQIADARLDEWLAEGAKAIPGTTFTPRAHEARAIAAAIRARGNP